MRFGYRGCASLGTQPSPPIPTFSSHPDFRTSSFPLHEPPYCSWTPIKSLIASPIPGPPSHPGSGASLLSPFLERSSHF